MGYRLHGDGGGGQLGERGKEMGQPTWTKYHGIPKHDVVGQRAS